MIQCNQLYNTETNETEREYYWFDNNFKRHGGYATCFDALEELEQYANDLEKTLNEIL